MVGITVTNALTFKCMVKELCTVVSGACLVKADYTVTVDGVAKSDKLVKIICIQ